MGGMSYFGLGTRLRLAFVRLASAVLPSLRTRLGGRMDVKVSKTRLKGVEALLPVLSDLSRSHCFVMTLLVRLSLSLDMVFVPLHTALFGAVHCDGARCCYSTGDAEAAH